MFRFDCRRARCTILNIGQFPIDAEVLFPHAPAGERAAALARHDLPDRGIPFQLQTLLVELEGHRLLVDPGGLDHSGTLRRALSAAGFDPSSIETVILTHAHLDHYAACIDSQGRPGFPKATIILQQREWDHWSAPDNPEPDHARNFEMFLAPLRERVQLVDGDCEIAPGVNVILAAGHSPGHQVVSIDRATVFVGDVVQHAIQVEHPDWPARFDVWPEAVVSTRRKLLDRLASESQLVIAPHLAQPLGHLVRSGDAFEWAASNATGRIGPTPSTHIDFG